MIKYQPRLSPFYLCLLSFFYVQFLFAQSDKHSPEKEKQIDELFADLDKKDQPGAAIAVVKDGKVLYAKGYGMANLEYDIPVQTNTVFHAASLSKQFTAFAILLLEKRGKLSLDDEVRKYIPELPDFGEKITLRHLATHSSGLRDQWRLLMMAGWRLDDVITKEQIFKLIENQQALNFKPGDKNQYSNTGFTILAEVIARVSGQSFPDFMRDNIFLPLGMDNTLFYDDHEMIVKNRAYSYYKDDGEYKKKVLSYATVGATSLFVTADDFAKWALNFTNPKVGDAEIIAALNRKTTLNNGKETGFALGQFVGTYYGIDVIVHSGSDAGYRAYFARIPEFELAVVVLANASWIDAGDLAGTALGLYVEDYFEEEEEERTIFEPDPATFIELSKTELEQFCGKYWEPVEFYTRKIYLKDNTIYYYRSEGNETKLVPIAPNEFKMIGDTENVSVVFNKTEAGEDRMQLFINDRKPINYLAYTPVNLADYTGTYHSEELSTVYNLVEEDGKLIIKHQRLSDLELKPINRNIFTSDNGAYQQLVFDRDKTGKVTGIKISNGRINDLVFEKVSN